MALGAGIYSSVQVPSVLGNECARTSELRGQHEVRLHWGCSLYERLRSHKTHSVVLLAVDTAHLVRIHMASKEL